MTTFSAEQMLREHGIRLDSYVSGEHSTTCPRCSHKRKPEHRKLKCLSVKIDDRGVCWHCNHPDCNWKGPEKGSGGNGRAGEFEATYNYCDADDSLVFQKVRNPPGHKNRFWCRRPNGRGGWINNIKGVKAKPLYRWPEIVEAMALDREIAVAEGEKDCDNLWRIRIPATCNFDGAAPKPTEDNPNPTPKWKPEYSKRLAGARLIVFNDNDDPGRRHADAVCRMSIGVAKRVRRLDLAEHWPDMPENGDVSDWLAAGHTREELEKLIAEAPDYCAEASAETGLAENNSAVQWRGCRKDGSPADTMHNARLALTAVGVECSFDTFHNKLLVGRRGDATRHELQSVIGEMSDHTIIRLRQILGDLFGAEFGDKSVRDAVTSLALEHRFDPVCDMLDQAQAAWDGKERLDSMAVDYANCADTPLNCAVMRKTMIAAVRRARRPGFKFDNITVLESEEGWNKSTFWRVLAGEENFSDESILGRSGREIQEQLSEVWIHESADLAGMRKAEVEAVKAFASRQVDIARPAYGYFVKKQKRHAINVGTTNSDEYLQSQTGNRRFWPLKVLKRIDIEKLERSRLQLWGEAATYEAKGEPITIPQELWDAAAAEQEKRRVKDPWEDVLADIPKAVKVYERGSTVPDTIKIIHDLGDKEFVSSADVLAHVLEVPTDRQDRHHSMRLADAMKRLGWARERATIGGCQCRGFARLADLAILPGLGLASKK